MATVTQGYNWSSGEIVTPAKMNLAAAPNVVVADNEVTASKIADGAVSDAKLASTLNLSSKTVTLPAAIALPSGAVMSFAMSSAPSGWLAANGAAVSRSTYSALFSAIGTTYGSGDGSTTFNLPDLRGYFVRGSGTNADGTAAGAFGVKQADALKTHAHTYTDQNWEAPGGQAIFGSIGGYRDIQTKTTSATGDSETRPKNIALLYCIKF